MLCLSRHAGERILIGNEIVITILRIGPSAVRVGISAPQELPIVREELVNTTESEKPCPSSTK